MIINKLTPQSYCGGVTNALNIIDNCLKDNNTKRPIYMLGSIIHNDHITKKYEQLGVIILEDKNKTRLELLDNITTTGTVIFSAHGVADNVYTKARQKNLDIIDATCPYVKMIHDRIKNKLNEGYDILYIGNKKHPETEGVIGIDERIHLITNMEDIDNINTTNKVYTTNQTTLSIYDIKEAFDKINNKYNASIDDKICDATTKRQQAIMNQPEADLCIIVGDKKSSNTKKLYEVSIKHRGINAILVDSINDINKDIFNNVNVVNISSGASTPMYLVDEIIEYINNL